MVRSERAAFCRRLGQGTELSCLPAVDVYAVRELSIGTCTGSFHKRPQADVFQQPDNRNPHAARIWRPSFRPAPRELPSARPHKAQRGQGCFSVFSRRTDATGAMVAVGRAIFFPSQIRKYGACLHHERVRTTRSVGPFPDGSRVASWFLPQSSQLISSSIRC